MQKSIAQSDMSTVGAFLTEIGLGYEFDRDGDITFTLRLPGEANRQDGSPDWSRIHYSMQPDFSIAGEFTGVDQTDWAKRILRFYLVGSRMSAGILYIHAYPRIVPARFAESAHFRVNPTPDEITVFNKSQGPNTLAKQFSNGSFGVLTALGGFVSEETLRDAIGYMQEAAGSFLEGPFRGRMFTEPA